MSLTVTVIARDEERRLARCLGSLSWADELVVVVDDRTRDGTADVARRFSDRVYVRPFEGYAAQRTWAETQASGDWVLWVDADEAASDGLGEEVLGAIASGRHTAYRMPRLDLMFGRWIRHGGWYPQYHIRLYRKGTVRWQGDVHERPVVEGTLGTLRSPFLHFAHHSITEWVEKMSRYTTLEAQEMHRHGARSGVLRVTVEPVLYGGYKYFVQRGFLDGMHGLVLAALMGCYRLVRNLKLWDLRREARKGSGDPGQP